MLDQPEVWPGNYIHQTAIVDISVKMGTNNYIGPYCVIGEGVVLGDGNRFENHCSVGSPAEHKDFFYGNSPFATHIGSGNVFREFTTINSGTVRPTLIGNKCVMLRGSHHSHDSVLEDEVTLSCNVLVGGHSYIMKGAVCGLGAIMHQYSIIGAYAMLGMGTIVTKQAQVAPGEKYVGNPLRKIGMNSIGLQRGGVSIEALQLYRRQFWEMRGTV